MISSHVSFCEVGGQKQENSCSKNNDEKEHKNTQSDFVKIKPHTAEYKISLIKNNNPDVQDVVGSLVITIKESEGYISEQHSILKIRYTDGKEDDFETFIASWESRDGKKYHFNLKTSQNKEEEVTIRGRATLDGPKKEVIYQVPDNQKISLPEGTVFPLKLLRSIIDDAIDQKTSKSNIVFDGSNETFTVLQVDAMMQPFTSKIKIKGNTDLNLTDGFLVQMAVSDLNDKNNMDPAYVTSQIVQKDGILLSLEMEFPEIGFTTKAELVRVRLL
ncbi:MAG: hypothetical protein HEEMFOPI_00006 [Holosporales bacterium]